MNAERLHALINKIDTELAETQAVDNLTALAKALQTVVNQSTGQSQQQLANALTEFRSGLEKTGIPNWSPAWLELLKEIRADEILGDALCERVDAIISTNAITPAVAKQQLDEILGQIEELRTAVSSLQAGLGTLNIGQEELDPGECEVGFLIPRRAVDNELGPLAAELKELDFILRTVTEVAKGEVAPVKIRTVSSTDFLLLLAQHSTEAALFATIVERLIAGYKKILEIRKLHGELSQLVGPKALKDVAKQAENLMVKEINATAEEAIKQYPGKDSGRKNELRTALEAVLRKLADRIDRGFNIEIRMQPLPDADQEEAEKGRGAKASKERAEHQRIIEGASKELEFSHREGPPILHLDKPKRGESKGGTESAV
jgi:hypothetical protein